MVPLLWVYGVVVASFEALLTCRARESLGLPFEFRVHRKVVRASAGLLLLRDATAIGYDVQLALLWSLSTWWWEEPNKIVRLLAHVANAIACVFVVLSRHSPMLMGEAIVLARDTLLLVMMVLLGTRSFQRNRSWNFRILISTATGVVLFSHIVCTAISAGFVGEWVDGGWRVLALGLVLAHDAQTWRRLSVHVSETGIEIVAV